MLNGKRELLNKSLILRYLTLARQFNEKKKGRGSVWEDRTSEKELKLIVRLPKKLNRSLAKTFNNSVVLHVVDKNDYLLLNTATALLAAACSLNMRHWETGQLRVLLAGRRQ